MSDTPKTRLHSLLIGIDKYSDATSETSDTPRIHNLTGAVLDMESVKKFLTDELRVPDGPSIRTLTNAEASRNAIVHAIEELGKSENHVQSGDAILIYFAGHGLSTDKQEAIIPHGVPKGDVSFKNLISHSKFSGLLRALAKSKGDNITVILDCCHSATLTRGPSEEGYTYRGVEIDVSEEDDAEKTRAFDPNDGSFHGATSSHVLLAACAKDQKAREKERRGLFTQEVIRILGEGGFDKLTYEGLVWRCKDLANGLQTPHCVGLNRRRLLFNSVIRHPNQNFYRISLLLPLTGTHVEYTVHNSGSMTGLTPVESQLEVLDASADLTTKEALFHLTIRREDATSCVARVVEDLTGLTPPPTASARLTVTGTPLGSLRVFLDRTNDFLAKLFDHACRKLHGAADMHPAADESQVIDESQRANSAERWMVSSSEKEDAHLGVYLGAGDRVLEFKILDTQIAKLGSTRVAFTVPATIDHLLYVLRAAARFFYHLRRTPSSHLLRNKVAMHVHKLTETDDLDDDLIRDLQPDPESTDIIPCIDSVKDPEPWTVIADDGNTFYGVELKQESTMKLGFFASMFFFDCHTFEIRHMYGASAVPHNAVPNAPLRPNEPLPLNYGRGGGEPLRFTLNQGQDVEVGFVKVFVSNRWFNLSTIDQPALETIDPDVEVRGQPPKKPGEKGGRAPVVTWDEITLPIVQVKA